jgi:dolichol kinase
MFPGFADPAASAFGIMFGKRKFSGSKTLAGFYGFVLVSSILLLAAHVVFFRADPLSPAVLKGCVLASVIGGVSELFSGAFRARHAGVISVVAEAAAGRDNWSGVDDNFIIPVTVSFALLAVSSWTGMDFSRF